MKRDSKFSPIFSDEPSPLCPLNGHRERKTRTIRRVLGSILFLFLLTCICLFSIYGICQLYARNERIELRAQYEQLKLENEQLRRTCQWENVLNQILPSIAKDELNFLTEELRQREK